MAEAARGPVKIVQGNAACVEGAIAAGCSFFAGYPITPSSEIAEGMSQRLPLAEGVSLQLDGYGHAVDSNLQRVGRRIRTGV